MKEKVKKYSKMQDIMKGNSKTIKGMEKVYITTKREIIMMGNSKMT